MLEVATPFVPVFEIAEAGDSPLLAASLIGCFSSYDISVSGILVQGSSGKSTENKQ